jgi:hypothetical protein
VCDSSRFPKYHFRSVTETSLTETSCHRNFRDVPSRVADDAMFLRFVETRLDVGMDVAARILVDFRDYRAEIDREDVESSTGEGPEGMG